MLRRSDFIAVTYAFDFVLANFGIAIAAKMPMMTTTISSSMSVKPFRARSMLVMELPCGDVWTDVVHTHSQHGQSVITTVTRATPRPTTASLIKLFIYSSLAETYVGP